MQVEPNHVYVIPPGKNLVFGQGLLQLAPARRKSAASSGRSIISCARSPRSTGIRRSASCCPVLRTTARSGSRRSRPRAESPSPRTRPPSSRACRRARSRRARRLRAAAGRDRQASSAGSHDTRTWPRAQDESCHRGQRKLDAANHRDPAARDRRRLRRLQAQHAQPPHRATHGAAPARRPARLRSPPPKQPGRGRRAVPGRTDQRHELLPQSGRVRRVEDDGIPPAHRSAVAPGAGAHLGARLLDRRGSLLARDGVHRVRRAGRTPCGCADLRHRSQRQRHRPRAHGDLLRRASSRTSLRNACAGFSSRVDGSYRIAKTIRDMCVFARHNVLADPPFSRLDLVACRNSSSTSSPASSSGCSRCCTTRCSTTASSGSAARRPSGRIATSSSLLDAKHKIYAKKPAAARRYVPPTGRRWEPHRATSVRVTVPPREPTGADSQREAERFLLSRYAPPSVVLNDELDIVQFRGDTGPFLAPAPGTRHAQSAQDAARGIDGRRAQRAPAGAQGESSRAHQESARALEQRAGATSTSR